MSGVTNKVPVLLFGSRIAAYGAIRGLVAEQIPVYIVCRDGSGLATRSRFVKKTFVLDPFEDGFLDRLRTVADQVGGEAVIMVAGDDDYLDVLSKNKSLLPDGFRCTFHGWEVVSTVRKKYVTYQKCSEIEIAFPRTFYVRSDDELRDTLTALDIQFPVLLKSGDSTRFLKQFGTKGILAHCEKDVTEAYRRYRSFFRNLLLSEYIPGGEELLVNLMAVGDLEGHPIQVFMNRKVRSSGRFLSCTLMETYYSKRLLEDSLKLMAYLGYYGYFNTEFKLDPRDGSLKLMEVNGRITLSNSHALLCGFNLPFVMYQSALYQSALVVDGWQPPVYKSDSYYRAIWWEPLWDLYGCIRLSQQDGFSLRQYLMSLRAASRIIEPFWWKDPIVGAVYVWRWLSYLVKAIGRRIWKR